MNPLTMAIQVGAGFLDKFQKDGENRKAMKLWRKTRGTNFARLRRDAIRGGFNPLTALQATGGAGYTGSSEPPALASTAFMGSVIADTWASEKARDHDAEMIRLQMDAERQLQQDQIRAMEQPGYMGYGLTGAASGPVSNGLPELTGRQAQTPGSARPGYSWVMEYATNTWIEQPTSLLQQMNIPTDGSGWWIADTNEQVAGELVASGLGVVGGVNMGSEWVLGMPARDAVVTFGPAVLEQAVKSNPAGRLASLPQGWIFNGKSIKTYPHPNADLVPEWPELQ